MYLLIKTVKKIPIDEMDRIRNLSQVRNFDAVDGDWDYIAQLVIDMSDQAHDVRAIKSRIKRKYGISKLTILLEAF